MDVVLTRVLDQLKLYMILVLVSLMLVGMDMAGWIGGIKGGLAYGVLHAQAYTKRTFDIFTRPIAAISKYGQMEKELALARERLKSVYVSQAELEELRRENEDLKALSKVELDEDIGVKLVADVIWTKSGAFLNKGARDGMKEGMVVVDPSGVLVGKVESVNLYLSRLRLLSDRESVVGVRVLGDVTVGVMAGDGFRGILQEVLQTDPLDVDDVLVTTGSEGIYPDGIVVGVVESLEGDASDVTKGGVVRLEGDTSGTVFVLK